VSREERLAEIVAALQKVELRCLVMGGHAVRYYGLERYTNDFDLHLAPENWDELAKRMLATRLFGQGPLDEGPSWRPRDFRRFRIGALPDGQEEWLEFWRTNHLLGPFAELYQRREEGEYGGQVLPFMALPDLIASKETERDKDWDDIAVLEEFHDTRLLRQVAAGDMTAATALSQIRSRRGLEAFARDGDLSIEGIAVQAIERSSRSITQSLLLPFCPAASALPRSDIPIEPVVLNRLRSVKPASPLHFAIVEIVRRRYRQIRQAADRADKDAIRAAQAQSGEPS
jgi:hypothetical protein